MQDENFRIAQTILSQLGGQKFMVMTGAKRATETTRGLVVLLPLRKESPINVVRIILEADDTYTVTFERFYANEFTVISTHEGIYCDMLRSLFESKTGLRTSLGVVAA